MKAYRKTVEKIIEDQDAQKARGGHWRSADYPDECPIPLHVIPNYMGINLCSVESVAWAMQDDGQLVSLTIHFTPATPEQIAEQGGLP